MSTRCQIGVYDRKEDDVKDFVALIYRHCDGYPGEEDEPKSGVLADITPL